MWMFSCSEIYKSLNKQKRVNDFSAYGRFELSTWYLAYLYNYILLFMRVIDFMGKNSLVLKTHAKFSC